MIAYNYCYTTCLGNINDLLSTEAEKRFGVKNDTSIDFKYIFKSENDFKDLDSIKDKIYIAPNKVAFVKKSVREGIIPKILHEFLVSRIMIKNSQRLYRDYPFIQKLLNSRQLALKLFMNVMYGYTGASFSGRMPSSDVADSVVGTGRFIL